MKYYLVCPVGAISGQDDYLTYHSDVGYKVGDIVSIPFGKSNKIGVVFSLTSKPSFSTKAIDCLIGDYTLPEHILELAKWISEYYATRLSIVLQTILPSGLNKKRREPETSINKSTRQLVNHNLTKDQQSVFNDIKSSNQTTHILHGVTGSGKTRVYQELTKEYLANNKSVIILVPEISLTPQLSAEFKHIHNNVMVLHSKLTEAQRHINWTKIIKSNDTWVLIGPRSTLYSPLTNLGLIVIDEAHEPSYQQDSRPQYNTLRVARKLADLINNNTKLVLGTATPSVSDYYFATLKKSPIHRLSNPTTKRDMSIEIVDLTDKSQFGANMMFSKKLINAMNTAITQNEQIMLFHNRRGTARMCLCSNCGWSAKCPNCHVPFRLHHDSNNLLCHLCGLKSILPKTCPECMGVDIDFKGFGSKKIEAEVKKLYPKLTVARFDSDTEVNSQVQNKYQDLYDNKIQVIVGTQGIAKGLDLPHLNTVGIIQADTELFIPDYSSSERAFQLITQVIGRAGRQGNKSSVVIQTLNPEHPVIQYGAKQDYDGFYNYELLERQSEHMPPFVFLLQLTVGYTSKTSSSNEAKRLSEVIKNNYPKISIRGPAPAFYEHRGSKYFQQLIVASPNRSILVDIAKKLPQRWHFTLDPINLM